MRRPMVIFLLDTAADMAPGGVVRPAFLAGQITHRRPRRVLEDFGQILAQFASGRAPSDGAAGPAEPADAGVACQ
jgi:hypothetical protein